MVKIGDIVTWRERPNSIGIRGCKVVELGETEDGKPAARLHAMGREVCALVEHLTIEDKS